MGGSGEVINVSPLHFHTLSFTKTYRSIYTGSEQPWTGLTDLQPSQAAQKPSDEHDNDKVAGKSGCGVASIVVAHGGHHVVVGHGGHHVVIGHGGHHVVVSHGGGHGRVRDGGGREDGHVKSRVGLDHSHPGDQ